MTSNQQKAPAQQQGQQKDTGQQGQQGQQDAGLQAQAARQRSENLLPPDDADDGRYNVAEEVNLDEQSDTARRVGKAPAGATLDAMGAALQDEDDEPDDAGKAGGA